LNRQDAKTPRQENTPSNAEWEIQFK